MALISGRKETKRFEELQILWIYTIRLCGKGPELPVMDTSHNDIHGRNFISGYIPE